MADFIGSCGHRLDDKWFSSGKGEISIKAYGRDKTPTVSYIVVCSDCRIRYEKEKKILKTRTDREMWRSSKERERLKKRKEKSK